MKTDFGRVVNRDGSISPSEDTGFRYKGPQPVPIVNPDYKLPNDIPNGASVHEDDITFLGAKNDIPYISVDLKKMDDRATADIHRNITAQKDYLAKKAAKDAEKAKVTA